MFFCLLFPPHLSGCRNSGQNEEGLLHRSWIELCQGRHQSNVPGCNKVNYLPCILFSLSLSSGMAFQSSSFYLSRIFTVSLKQSKKSW